MQSSLRVPTTKQIRELEASWIKSARDMGGGNWGQVLMEVAGRGAAMAALEMWQEHPGPVVVVCGRGNNGGDGLVIARYLNLWGIPVQAAVLGTAGGAKESAKSAPAKTMTSDEAEANLKMLEKTGASIIFVGDEDASDKGQDKDTGETKSTKKSGSAGSNPAPTFSAVSVDKSKNKSSDKVHEHKSLSEFEDLLGNSTLIVDAIFGTGLSRPVGGLEKKAIEAINHSYKNILAVDIASGVNSDSGQIMGSAVRATKTVTFGYLKPGHLQYPGAAQSGDLGLVDIGLPDFSFAEGDDGPRIYLTTGGAVQAVMPHRPTNSHKGTYGNLLTIAGSLGMSGAGVLCGFSALRTGAGLSYVATAKSLIGSLPVEELVYRPLSETSAHSISRDALKEVAGLMETISALVLGPGLSQNADTVSFVLDLLDLINKPCVIDADGLNALAQNTKCLGTPARNFVLTPHPKELSRLTGKSVEEISSDRIGHCLAAAKQFDCVVVLKGAYSVVASPDEEVYINPTGNPGMSTAGAGDVLSGIIGGLLAQGLAPFDAAVAGVYLHGKAGDIASETVGHTGTVAGDITAAIPHALTAVTNGEFSRLEEMLSRSVAAL